MTLRDASVFSHSSFQFAFNTNTGSILLKNKLDYATPFSHIFSGCLMPAWQPHFSMSHFTLDHSEQSCASHMFLIHLSSKHLRLSPFCATHCTGCWRCRDEMNTALPLRAPSLGSETEQGGPLNTEYSLWYIPGRCCLASPSQK